MALLKASGASAQTPAVPPPAAKPVQVSSMPERFFQIQDSSGFFWQAFGNGSLVSGETQYLQSGLNLIVDGEGFAPVEALVREPGTGGEKVDIRFDEKRNGLSISRDLWFDTRRSAVRVFDTLSNTGTVEQSFVVALRTTYPFAWQSLHGSGGTLLSNDPALRLGARDYSLGVHFSPSEGRHDTLFVIGSEKGGQKPELKASANSRELSFVYTLVIPPGESRSLLHWILQRNLTEVSADQAAISPFLQRDKLIVPEVEEKSFAKVVNFVPSAFHVESAAPTQIKSLLALNELTDRIGLHRRSEDMLWISPTNQVSGSVNREAILTIATTSTGDQVVKVSDIAALKGGAGTGRNILTYLRDGRVLAGPLRQGELKWTMAAGTAAIVATPEVLDPADLNLLLFATGPGDGVAPAKTTHFLQLIDGSVLPMVNDPATQLEWITPWGMEKWQWGELVEAVYTSVPSPRLRVVHRNGSQISAFLPAGTWAVNTAFSKVVEVPSTSIERIWVAGGTLLVTAPLAANWLDFAEVPSGQGPSKGFLLTGNHLLEGGFAEPRITLSDKGNFLRLETSLIASMRRSLEPESENLIEVGLSNGEKFVGEFTSPYIRISRAGGEMEIPAVLLLAFRNTAP